MLVVAVLLLTLAPTQGSSLAEVPASSGQKTLSPSEIGEFQTKAETGDQNAQVALGKAYQEGNGVPQNFEQAVKWYRKAADQGNAEAQNDLGVMFRLGRGVEKNEAEAVRWYRLAARQKNPHAMFNLGLAYYNGDGVEADNVSAYSWFLLAEEAGSKTAIDAARHVEADMKPGGIEDGLLKVALMYELGEGVSQDTSEALLWYHKAAERGVREALVKQADILSSTQATPHDYEELRSSCENAANQNYYEGFYCLGRIYRNGLGVTRDPHRAEKLFSKAAWLGDARSMFQLGEMYVKGDGVKPNKITAYAWMLLALSCGERGAVADAQSLQRELSKNEMEKGQEQAEQFLKQRPFAHLRIPAPVTN